MASVLETQGDNEAEKVWLLKFFDDPPAPLDAIEPVHIRKTASKDFVNTDAMPMWMTNCSPRSWTMPAHPCSTPYVWHTSPARGQATSYG